MPQTGVEHMGNTGHKMLGKKLKLRENRYKRLKVVRKIVSHLFDYSVVIFAPPVVCPKHGNIHVAIGVHNVFSNSPESGSKSFSGAWDTALP